MNFVIRPLLKLISLACAGMLLAPAALAADTVPVAGANSTSETEIERVQVTGQVLNSPGQLVMDPKAPR